MPCPPIAAAALRLLQHWSVRDEGSGRAAGVTAAAITANKRGNERVAC